jgi:hypothetical protein
MLSDALIGIRVPMTAFCADVLVGEQSIVTREPCGVAFGPEFEDVDFVAEFFDDEAFGISARVFDVLLELSTFDDNPFPSDDDV